MEREMTLIRVAFWTAAIGCMILFPPAIPAVIVLGIIAKVIAMITKAAGSRGRQMWPAAAHALVPTRPPLRHYAALNSLPRFS